MKRLLLTLLCLTALTVFAQENRYYTDTGKMTNYWGIRVNYDHHTASYGWFCGHEYLPFGAGSGVSAGGVYHWSFGKRFFLEPGGELYYNTNGITSDFYNEYLKDTGTLSTMGIRVPVKIGIAFHTKHGCVLLYTGASESYSFYGREKTEFKNPEIPKVDRSAFKTIKRFETHVCLGVTYAHGKLCYAFNLNFGVANNLRLKDYSTYRSIVQLGVGYNF